MADRFTFDTEPHGAGGFAKVIKGRDNTLERDIAIKVLDPLVKAFADADLERFKREARILAKLSHPNIPAIYDVDFDSDKFLIVFQFIEGKTLKEFIDQEGPCQLELVKNWFHQIASALDHAHASGVVHRDIKPANIIIKSNQEIAYVVDFGIALTAEDAKKLTKSGFAIGTAGYMSPEQSAGEIVDHRTDIYSLGVTLYEALAGEAIPVGQYLELSAANEAIPPEIDNLIRDCLLPKNQRLDSAKAFSARLAGALRPLKPLSEILAHGKLYELASALEELSAEAFAQLPPGQIALILAKIADITSGTDTKLETASVALLTVLLNCGILLQKEDYREIVRPAIEWAFVRTSSKGNRGYDTVRRALSEAAFLARASAHEVLQEEVVCFLKKTKLDDQPEWYLHTIRELLNTLLANPSCTNGASDLAKSLREINKIQRARPA